MEQPPNVTLTWALRCLEQAVSNLDDGPAERRVRRQLHQVLLAVERAMRLASPPAPPDHQWTRTSSILRQSSFRHTHAGPSATA
jgi:hypothetical protein